MKRAMLIGILIGFALISSTGARAQGDEPTQAHLALQVIFYPNEQPAYQPVRRGSSGTWYSRFHRIKSPGPNELPVNAVDIKSILTADGVRVTVSVLFGELHEQQKQVATYTLHPGQKIKTAELTQFGIDPFTIAAVNYDPVTLEVPEFVSKAPSIDLVGIQPAASMTPAFRVAVRNLSNKNVQALFVSVTKVGEPQKLSMSQGKEGAPFITPGNLSQFDAHLATRSSLTAAGFYTQVAVPGQVIEVTGAVFDDGSFEGDVGLALNYAATLKGDKIQLARVISLIDEAMADSQSDPAVALEAFKQKIAMLNLEADQAWAQEVIDKIGQPVKTTAADLKTIVEVGMKGILSHALNAIQQFQLRNPKPASADLQRWLALMKTRYETWLSHLN